MDAEISKQAEEFRKLMGSIKNTTMKFQPMKILSVGEATLLANIKANEDQGIRSTSSDLSGQLNISKPATSRMLNAVEEKGLIERVIEKKDRRVVFVKLTSVGIRILSEEFQEYISTTEHIVRKMGSDDMNAFLKTCSKLCTILQDEISLLDAAKDFDKTRNHV